ncbi:AGAP012000-PA-like protein [Anopheles sinensis]|uniref:AGAP012000-PA-like protein n=1 Tax=Anopheles sinensis TaxID=74873 RepID=A0A084WEF2_ANOSI|nr:AGAP012000-PA-like protein [Anopheles sinensis]
MFVHFQHASYEYNTLPVGRIAMNNAAVLVFLIIGGCAKNGAEAEGVAVTRVQLLNRLASLEDRINGALADAARKQQALVTKLELEIRKTIDDLTNQVELVSKQDDCSDQSMIIKSQISNVELAGGQQKKQILRRMKHIAAETEDRLIEKIDVTKESLTNLILSRRTANKCYGKVDVSGLLTADERLFPVMYDFSLGPGFETDSDFGGGWILFQRRFDGSIDFNRSWSEYRNGFGDLVQGEFWLGLQKLYMLMRFCPQELLVVVEFTNGEVQYGYFVEFAITNESDGYRVKEISRCVGTWCFISMTTIKNNMFSAYDRDNDVDLRNCAATHGGWWYFSCLQERIVILEVHPHFRHKFPTLVVPLIDEY